MLAYVFWHSPQAGVDPTAYEGALLRFHRSLDPTEIDGFHNSSVFRIDAVPWMTGSLVYEDWYLLTNFSALGTLNIAAVSGHRQPPHENVALLAEQGTAGVYALRHGLELISDEGRAAWFPKPAGTSSDQVVRVTGGRGQLWQRQLVLGPTPEFCVIAGDAPPDAVVVTRTSVS